MSNKKIFNTAFEYSIGHEGGYVNDPRDRGGETKYGISKRSYPDVNIANLTVEQAKEIYYRDWWKAYNYDRLPDAVAIKVFDTAINVGARVAHRFLQKACVIWGVSIKIDGLIGGQTVRAVHSIDADTLVLSIGILQGDYYLRIVESRPDQKRFINGWLRRARASLSVPKPKLFEEMPVPVRGVV